MTPTDFFAQVKLKEVDFRRPEKNDDFIALIYDPGGDLWQGQVKREGMAYQGTGRTVAECFEVLMHGLRKHELLSEVQP